MNKKTVPALYSVILFMSILLGFYSVFSFVTATHNIDLGFNLNIMSAYGLTFVDTNSLGETWLGNEIYIYGQEQLKTSLFLFGVSIFLITLTSIKLYDSIK